MSYKDELRKLGEQAERRHSETATEGMGAPAHAFYEGCMVSPENEVMALFEHVQRGDAAGHDLNPRLRTLSRWWLTGIDPEKDPEATELFERIMRRTAPTLADEIRVRRCALWRSFKLDGRGSPDRREYAVMWKGANPMTREEADDAIAEIKTITQEIRALKERGEDIKDAQSRLRRIIGD